MNKTKTFKAPKREQTHQYFFLMTDEFDDSGDFDEFNITEHFDNSDDSDDSDYFDEF